MSGEGSLAMRVDHLQVGQNDLEGGFLSVTVLTSMKYEQEAQAEHTH